jgi:hypothetical protein
VDKQSGIYWLASYPKSGNTWFRVILAHLLKKSEQEKVDLNRLQTGMIASSREWMDQCLGFDSALLSHDELDALRPSVYEWYSQDIQCAGYHKVHDAYTYLDAHTPMFPTAGCLGALYFIRNPLDVVISFANHSSCSIDKAIESMGNREFAFCGGQFRQFNQLRQWLQSWSMHVNSWLNARNNISVLVIRYEDMVAKSYETFASAVKFLGLTPSESALKHAISQSSIEKLQAFEAQLGFSEKPTKVARFFRKGIVGDWREVLTPDQIKRIIEDHGQTMHAFGYIDDNAQPL